MDNCTVIGAAQCTGWIVGAGHGHAGCCDGMSEGRKLVRTLHLHSVPVNRGHGAQGDTSRTCLITPDPTWSLDTASNIHLIPFFHFCCVSVRPWICRTFTISLEPSRQMICWPVTCQVSECSEVTSDHGSSATCRPHLGLGPLRPVEPLGLGTSVQQLWYRCCTIFGERPFWSLLLERPTSGLTQNL